MKTCTNCGAQIEDNFKFCGECGAKQETKKCFCPECGTEHAPDTKFCMECGTSLTGNAQSSTAINQSSKSANSELDAKALNDGTITVVYRGIPFNLKLVVGEKGRTQEEVGDFYMFETPVTQALWMTVMGNNPSSDMTELNYPVTNITGSLATSFLIKVQKITGVKFELPTKEQWEYAYQGGHKNKGFKYSGSNELSEVGWTDNELHIVGELLPNELGLMDMDGNVEELLKGEKLTKYNPNNDTYLDKSDFTGVRLVINNPTEIEGEEILQNAISSCKPLLKKIHEDIENRRKAEEEAAAKQAEEEAKMKAEALKKKAAKYKGKGIIRYSDFEEADECSQLVFGKEYIKLSQEAKILFEKVKAACESDDIHWEALGEPGFSPISRGWPGDQQSSGIEYIILEGNVLVLNGTCDMKYWYWNANSKHSNYWKMVDKVNNKKREIKHIVVLGELTEIPKSFFQDFTKVEIVLLPDTIEEINRAAFWGCYMLKYINWPDDLLYIREKAFFHASFPNLILPPALELVEEDAFIHINTLKSVLISESTTIHPSSFRDCKSMK